MTLGEVKFKFLVEYKDTTTGESKWHEADTSPAISIEDVSVESTALLQVNKCGQTPSIIPFGINGDKGRIALLTGVFKGRSMTYIGESVDQYLDVLQSEISEGDGQLGRGLMLNDADSYKLLPELGFPKGHETPCRWKIDSFTWDRQAIKVGQWRFNMQLSYVWEPLLNELQLYEDGVGTVKRDNVKFAVTASTNKTYASGTVVYNPKLTISVHDLNKATFTLKTQTYNKGDLIKVFCETQPLKAVFFGVVDEIKRDTTTNMVTYDCTEIGTLLQRIPCAKMGAGLFRPKMKITNPVKPDVFRSLGEMVGIILKVYEGSPLTGFTPGLGVDKTGKWGAMSVIPASGDDITGTKLPPQLLSGNSVFSALTQLLKDQCGMYIWFNNDTGSMEYGFIRNQKGITINPSTEYIMNSSKTDDNADEYNADYVVLYDLDGHCATSIDGDMTSKTYISYQWGSPLIDFQLKTMAKRIHKDMQLTRDVFKVTFPAGTVRFEDGDAFTCLGDATVEPQMTLRDTMNADPTTDPGDTAWQIKTMIITDRSTECLVGASYYSVFDLYRNQLKRVANAPVQTENKNVVSNVTVVSAQPTTTEV